jgi:tetratricopeptide (TPR) repeat protein
VDTRRDLAAAHPGAFSADLALTLHNLGGLLRDQGRPEDALPVTREALELYRRLAREEPLAYEPSLALCLNMIGMQLDDLGQLEEACEAGKESVEIHRRLERQTPGAFRPELARSLLNLTVMPGLHRSLQGNLGRLLFYLLDWRRSAESLQAALRAGERLYQASATPEGKLAELREVMEYPPRIAYSLAELGQPVQALEALEGNRARLLAEALDLGETEIQKASETDRLAFEAARRTISRLETEVRALEPGSSEAFVAISGKLREAQKDLAAVVERVRSYAPDFLPAGLDLPALAALTRKTGQPLVFLASSPHGSLALIVAPGDGEPETIWLDEISSFDLRDLLFGSEREPGYIA